MFKFSTGFANETLSVIASKLQNGCIEIYSGTQPTSADSPVKGTLLGVVTAGGLPFTAGSPANGLQFEVNTDEKTLNKSSSQVWQFTCLESGVAGWLRLKANAVDAGSTSETAIRIDGTIAAYGGDATIDGSTSLVKDKIYTLSSLSLKWGQ